MTERGRNQKRTARMPATKFSHLQKRRLSQAIERPPRLQPKKKPGAT